VTRRNPPRPRLRRKKTYCPDRTQWAFSNVLQLVPLPRSGAGSSPRQPDPLQPDIVAQVPESAGSACNPSSGFEPILETSSASATRCTGAVILDLLEASSFCSTLHSARDSERLLPSMARVDSSLYLLIRRASPVTAVPGSLFTRVTFNPLGLVTAIDGARRAFFGGRAAHHCEQNHQNRNEHG